MSGNLAYSPAKCCVIIHHLFQTQWHSHWGGKGDRVPPLTVKNLPIIGKKSEKIRKNRKKIRKNREKEEKSGRKGKNREVSFTLPLLTGLATLLFRLFSIANVGKLVLQTITQKFTRLCKNLMPICMGM